MSDFLEDVVNSKKLDECNGLLDHAESIIGTTIVDRVNELTTELDELVEIMHKKVNREGYEISDKELEKLLIRIPILVYELNNVLMKVGIKEDLSKIIRQTNYNEAFMVQEGTIADKKSGAELAIKEELLLETTWKRSVKIISQKMDIAQELLSAVKKIYSRRMEEISIIKRSPNI